MASRKIVSYSWQKCTGCKLCMLACSWVRCGACGTGEAVIRIDVDEKVFVRTMALDEERCSGCLACVQACPGAALTAAEPGSKEAV